MEELITAAMHGGGMGGGGGHMGGGGGMGGGGHGGGEETASNNLSKPVIFTEGVGLTLSGSPNTFSFTTPYDLNGDSLITDADKIAGYYLFAQKTTGNEWQADSLLIPADDLDTTNLFVSTIDWGDSIEGGKPIAVNRPTRIEVSFYKNLAEPLTGDVALDSTMTGYPMELLANASSPTEVQGASASDYPITGELPNSSVLTEESTEASVYAHTAQFVLQYINGTPEANDFLWDSALGYWADADPTDTVTIEEPVSGLTFSGEVTVSGKVVYGLSQGGWSPDQAGTYRATVFFPKAGNLQLGQAEILASSEESITDIVPLAQESGGEEPPTESGPGAQIDGLNNLTYLDIFVNGNQPPVVEPIALEKTEDDPDFTLNLLSTATDPEGDLLTATNIDYGANDGRNPITLPLGTVEVEGSDLVIRPRQLNDLTAGQRVIIQASFVVSDGENSSPSTATITVEGRDELTPPSGGGGGSDGGGTSVSPPTGGGSSAQAPSPIQTLDRDDVILGTDGDDRLQGGRGQDRLYGNSGRDLLRGGKDDDFLQGGVGDDSAYGDLGNDVVRGGKDNDMVQGGMGNDTVYGDMGNDVVRGGKDDDILEGGMGDDMLYGDLGNDLLDGGAGFDVLTGGAGEDTFRIRLADMTGENKQPDRILDFDLQSDRLDLDDTITRQMLTFGDGILMAQINGQAIALAELTGLNGISGPDLISQLQIV